MSDPMEVGMSNVTSTEIRPKVIAEFANQNHPSADDAAIDTVTTVCVGCLRNSDPWPFDDAQAQPQVIAYFVQCYLSRWTPEYPTTGNLPGLIPDGFDQRRLSRPPDAIIDALIKIAVGILRQPSLPKPKPAPVVVSDRVVSFYVQGA
jgi:hypothetical protein